MDWTKLTLWQSARCIQEEMISAEDYAAALLRACDVGKALNAFISLDPDRVLSDARAHDLRAKHGYPTGPLHGIPIAVKDVFDVDGTPTTAGTPALRSHQPGRTAPLVQTLFNAGALMLGKTNMHELAFGVTSGNDWTGPVQNPHDRTMSPGGSSGGTAAAVAAHMAPAGLGSDTSGSIRIPAAHCGIVGYRPSTGRYPTKGMIPMNHTRDAPGLMARCVDDIAFLDEIIVGGSSHHPADLAGTRIGLPRDYFFDGLDGRIRSMIDKEIARLSDLGVIFVEASPPDFAEAREALTEPIMTWEMARDMQLYLRETGSLLTFEGLVRAVASPDVKAELQRLLVEDRELESRYRHALAEILPRHRAEYETYLRNNDLQAIVFPTSPIPPPPLGENEMVSLNGEPVSIWRSLRNAVPATLLGAPCLSLPIPVTDDGPPVGFEFDGWPGKDSDILEIGLAWELATLPPPFGQHPFHHKSRSQDFDA